MHEERHEVLARGQLDVPVAEVGHQAGQLQQRDVPQHVRIYGELHRTGSSFGSSRSFDRAGLTFILSRLS